MKKRSLSQRSIRLWISFTFLCFTVISCDDSSDSQPSPTPVSKVLPYCDTVVTPNSPVTISGLANYFYRTNGNGPVNATPRPIRYAEVRVLDAANNIVQCGTTNENGQFSIAMENGTASHTLQVTSRSFNSFGQIYILNNPTNNAFFSLNSTFIPDGSKDLGTLSAQATGELKGGAFNILDQIHNANDFLRTETSSCGTLYPNCSPIETPPLVSVYWSPGVNPGTYFSIFSGLSFYTPDNDRLYILGGISGDVDNTDTDHFDNSIILHEYAHFLEDIYSSTDSPGGGHNGNSIIDPRLAWGEGWANFFQAAVTGDPVYRDTFGNPEGESGEFFNTNLETPGASGEVPNDISVNAGEGNFREFSISRLLWDSIDTNNEGAGVDVVSGSFNEFWAVFAGVSSAFADPGQAFRNIGLFHVFQQNLPSASDWSSLHTAEKQTPNESNYGNSLNLGASCPDITIQASNINSAIPENGTFSNSNQMTSNDFYKYSHSGGALSIELTYTTTSSNPADLDIILWNQGYIFGDLSGGSSGFSQTRIPVGTSSASETLNVNIAAGTYLININVYTGRSLGTAANYKLFINGVRACPN